VAVVANMIGNERLDLNSAIGLARGDNINTKLKHIDIQGHWLRQEVANGILQI
jgi:hypothetical protein